MPALPPHSSPARIAGDADTDVMPICAVAPPHHAAHGRAARRNPAVRSTAMTSSSLVLEPHEQAVAGDARIVDQDVERPIAASAAGTSFSTRPCRRDCRAARACDHPVRARPSSASRLVRRSRRSRPAVQGARDRAADAAARAGDQGGLSREIEHANGLCGVLAGAALKAATSSAFDRDGRRRRRCA